ncbi:hypothetical protein G9A89_018293 [Geosiphon pyriformis]|nr:hypothetical protein G9A89_018293 [Geosiphon pyriformis]
MEILANRETKRKIKRNINEDGYLLKKLVTDERLLFSFQSFAYYANKAYCLEENDSDGIYGLEINNEYAVILYFRGTKLSFERWKSQENSLLYYDPLKKSKIHLEIFETFQKIEVNLLEKIAYFLNKFNKFHLAGHGLGGGKSIINMSNRILFFKKDVTVYTFGQPRIGNRQFSEHVNEILMHKVFRFTYDNDFLPQFPPSNKGWWHYEKEFWIRPSVNCDCFHKLGFRQTEIFECSGDRVSSRGRFQYVFVENELLKGFLPALALNQHVINNKVEPNVHSRFYKIQVKLHKIDAGKMIQYLIGNQVPFRICRFSPLDI